MKLAEYKGYEMHSGINEKGCMVYLNGKECFPSKSISEAKKLIDILISRK